MAQLSYTIEHRPAVAAGDLANSDLTHRIIAARNTSGADLPYGRMLKSDYTAAAAAHPTVNPVDNNSQAATLPSAITDTMLGISVRSAARAPGIDGLDVDGVRDGNMLDCLTQGKAYVATEDAVSPLDPVYVRIGASGVASGPVQADAGKFGKVVDTVTAWIQKTAYPTPGVRFAQSGKVYEVVTGGTSEDSVAGSQSWVGSTGSAILDGTAVIKYVGVCDSSTRASCVVVSNARYSKGTVDLAPNLPTTDAFGNTMPTYLAEVELAKP